MNTYSPALRGHHYPLYDGSVPHCLSPGSALRVLCGVREVVRFHVTAEVCAFAHGVCDVIRISPCASSVISAQISHIENFFCIKRESE